MEESLHDHNHTTSQPQKTQQQQKQQHTMNQRRGKRPPKSSSQRGREYRERMRLLEMGLDTEVAQLRRHVGELEMRRSIVDTRSLQRRHDSHGSLAALVFKYHSLFQESMAALPPATMALQARHDRQTAMDIETQYQTQAQFLSHIMDPNVIAGDLVGPLAILDQWRRYAASHGSFRAKILGITTSGSSENPVVTLHARATGRITGATFYTLFPHAVGRDPQLVQKFLDREVSYPITNRYLFNRDNGRIRCEIVDVGFAQGLLDAGATLREVAQLMDGAMISQHCTLKQTRPTNATISPIAHVHHPVVELRQDNQSNHDQVSSRSKADNEDKTSHGRPERGESPVDVVDSRLCINYICG